MRGRLFALMNAVDITPVTSKVVYTDDTFSPTSTCKHAQKIKLYLAKGLIVPVSHV